MTVVAQGPHEHGTDVPVLVGPLLLETLLTLGLVVAGVAVALRPFLDGRDASLVARTATLGAASAGLSLLLTAGPSNGMPTGVPAALAVASLAVPFAAVRGDRPRLRALAGRAAPFVLVVALVSALVATGAGALLAGVAGLAWSVLVVHRPEPLGTS